VLRRHFGENVAMKVLLVIACAIILFFMLKPKKEPDEIVSEEHP
jgi:hypothetical protein